jgi:hypothetical protein
MQCIASNQQAAVHFISVEFDIQVHDALVKYETTSELNMDVTYGGIAVVQ